MSEGIIIALIGLFSGGLATAILKILEKYLGKEKAKQDHEADMRTELRVDLDRKIKELNCLRAELRDIETELNQWRIDYWHLYESFFQLKILCYQSADNNPKLKEKLNITVAPHEAREAINGK